MTNVWTYVLIIFIAVLFITALQTLLGELLTSSNLDMSDDDINFTGQIMGIDLASYSKNKTELEEGGSDVTGDHTGSQLKDNAIEFFYSNTIAGRIGSTVKLIFTLPEFFMKLLKIDISNILVFVNILNWLWSIGLLLSTYYLIRGAVT